MFRKFCIVFFSLINNQFQVEVNFIIKKHVNINIKPYNLNINQWIGCV